MLQTTRKFYNIHREKYFGEFICSEILFLDFMAFIKSGSNKDYAHFYFKNKTQLP